MNYAVIEDNVGTIRGLGEYVWLFVNVQQGYFKAGDHVCVELDGETRLTGVLAKWGVAHDEDMRGHIWFAIAPANKDGRVSWQQSARKGLRVYKDVSVGPVVPENCVGGDGG